MEPTTNEEWAALCRAQIDTIERLAQQIERYAAPQQHAQAAQYDLDLRQDFLNWNRQQDKPPVIVSYEYGVFDKIAEMIAAKDDSRVSGNAQAALSDVVKYTRLARGVQNLIGNYPFGPWEDFYACDDVVKVLSSQQPPAAPSAPQRGFDRAAFTEQILLSVAEIPDRDSPEDQPEMMLVTSEELSGIIASAFEQADDNAQSLAAAPAIQQEGAALEAALTVALDALNRSEPMYSRQFSQAERKAQHIAAMDQARAALASPAQPKPPADAAPTFYYDNGGTFAIQENGMISLSVRLDPKGKYTKPLFIAQPAAVQQGSERDAALIEPLPQGWSAMHPEPWEALTDQAQLEQRVSVSRLVAPFCDKSGLRCWSGPTLADALRTAHEALGIAMAAQQDEARPLPGDKP